LSAIDSSLVFKSTNLFSYIPIKTSNTVLAVIRIFLFAIVFGAHSNAFPVTIWELSIRLHMLAGLRMHVVLPALPSTPWWLSGHTLGRLYLFIMQFGS